MAIGTFDGLHVGHRALIAEARAHARRAGSVSSVITWDRHPNAVLRPDKVPPLLSSPARKVELIAALDVDLLVVLAFDEDLARWPPERFVDVVLVRGLGASTVCVGSGWRFGHKAAGDVALLRSLGAKLGFEVKDAPLVEVRGRPVSSSRARAAVAQGHLPLASELLGRPFDLPGVVVHGNHRGKSLGYPTANLAVDPALVQPPRGVYAGESVVGGRRHKAAINVGVNPTFGGSEASPPTVEVYLLDFDGDLYGATLSIEFHRRLRDERRFDRVEDLVAQMARDVEEAGASTC